MLEIWECHFCGCPKGSPLSQCTAEDGEGHLFRKCLEETDLECLRRRLANVPKTAWFKKYYSNKPLGITIENYDD